MSLRVWLSYDLTVKGDYENLYIWLDRQKARECGDSMVTFFWKPTQPSNIKNEIRESLKEIVTFGKKDRIYLVFKKEDNSYTGSFIIGSRKSSPWEGASQESTSDDDE